MDDKVEIIKYKQVKLNIKELEIVNEAKGKIEDTGNIEMEIKEYLISQSNTNNSLFTVSISEESNSIKNISDKLLKAIEKSENNFFLIEAEINDSVKYFLKLELKNPK